MFKLLLLTLATTVVCGPALAGPIPQPTAEDPYMETMAEDLCQRDGTCSDLPPPPPKKPIK